MRKHQTTDTTPTSQYNNTQEEVWRKEDEERTEQSATNVTQATCVKGTRSWNADTCILISNNSQEVSAVSTDLSALEKLIGSLTDRVASLESFLRQRDEIIERKMDIMISKMSDQTQKQNIAVQTDKSLDDTYADIVKRHAPNQRDIRQEFKVPMDGRNQTSSKNGQESKKKKDNDVIQTINNKDDAKTPSALSSSKPASTNHKLPNNLPRVAFIHDSVMKDVQTKRLGRSYGFFSLTNNASKISDLQSSVNAIVKKSETPKIDALLIHCGLNDLKSETPHHASELFVKNVQSIANQFPQSKVVISKVAPVSDRELDLKRQMFNTLNETVLHRVKNLSFVSHEDLQMEQARHTRDGIHPSLSGSSVLARNVGRHLHRLLWEKIRQGRRQIHYNSPNFSNERAPPYYRHNHISRQAHYNWMPGFYNPYQMLNDSW